MQRFAQKHSRLKITCTLLVVVKIFNEEQILMRHFSSTFSSSFEYFHSLDPTRLLLTLGASHSLADNVHGNTALHWAIIAKNHTAIITLVRNGASLDVPNHKNETPMMMLGPHIGAAWLGHRFSQELRRKQSRAKTWCRDKVSVFFFKVLVWEGEVLLRYCL